MKMDKVAGSGNDEFYTPAYAVKPILKYIPKGSVVWCPFDTAESEFVKQLTKHGCKVMYSHISMGLDFFTVNPPECDFIVSNPPYSVKGDVLQRLFDIGTPFAMLVGVVGLFESQKRFDMFKRNVFEVMYFNKRIAYKKSLNDTETTLHPLFSSVYVCHNVLPRQIIFEEVSKDKNEHVWS